MGLANRILKIFDGSLNLAHGDRRTSAQMADGSWADAVVPVNFDGALLSGEPPVQGVIDMPVAATDYTPGRAVEVVTTTAGAVIFTYPDGSTRTRTYGVGLTRLPDAVKRWSLPAGSTFVGTLCNLK